MSDIKGQLPTNETIKKSQEKSTHSKEEKTEKKTEIEIKTTDDKDNIKKKNRKHSKKDKEVKEIVVPPLYVISKYNFFPFSTFTYYFFTNLIFVFVFIPFLSLFPLGKIGLFLKGNISIFKEKSFKI